MVDPTPQGDAGRGRVVDAVTESVDVLPTICEFMGADTPLQADGWPLSPFLRGEPTPEHWRDTAHFEWSFADPVARYAERALGLPMSHCSLAVSRGPRYEFVHFGAPADVFPPLLFDLESDPGRVENLLAGEAGPSAAGGRGPRDGTAAWEAAQELLHWYMRTAERTLSGSFLHPTRGLVEARDTWR